MTKAAGRTRLAISLGLLLTFGAFPIAAAAEGGPPVWGIRPADGGPVLAVSGQPGDVIDTALVASNSTDSPIALTLSTVGPQACWRGGFCFPADTADKSDAAAWLDFDDLPLVLEPGIALDIPLRISIPSDALPGVHAFGLVASLPPETAEQSGMQIRIVSRVGVRAIVTVGEPVPSCGFRVDGLAAAFSASGQWSMTLAGTNGGGMPWQGRGTLVLDTPQPQTFALDYGAVCSWCRVFYDLPTAAPPAGDYQAVVRLTDDGECRTDWQGVVAVVASESQQAQATRTQSVMAEVSAWLAMHAGTWLLVFGILCAAAAAAIVVWLIIIKRARREGGGRRRVW